VQGVTARRRRDINMLVVLLERQDHHWSAPSKAVAHFGFAGNESMTSQGAGAFCSKTSRQHRAIGALSDTAWPTGREQATLTGQCARACRPVLTVIFVSCWIILWNGGAGAGVARRSRFGFGDRFNGRR
jgi:hypothetical protein